MRMKSARCLRIVASAIFASCFLRGSGAALEFPPLCVDKGFSTYLQAGPCSPLALALVKELGYTCPRPNKWVNGSQDSCVCALVCPDGSYCSTAKRSGKLLCTPYPSRYTRGLNKKKQKQRSQRPKLFSKTYSANAESTDNTAIFTGAGDFKEAIPADSPKAEKKGWFDSLKDALVDVGKSVVDFVKQLYGDSGISLPPGDAGGNPSPGSEAGDSEISLLPGDAGGNPSPGSEAGDSEISPPPGGAGEYSSSIGEEGLALIARFEGSVRDSEGKHIIYDDQGGLPTIGYGHLITNPIEKAAYMDGITEPEALALFKDDISRFENAVKNSLTVQVSQPQFDALVSLAYNIGTGAFANSELLGMTNSGAGMSEIEAEWKSWNKVTIGGVKQVSRGLENRRELEWRLYSTGEY